ncbi:hypothetical protein [Paraburkholderia sp. SIMBA_027]|uniref:sulfotransferase-like domain-containing protein n=1 Tax=Paraburkholderia sp. SIMBA_027 TaxID=3085770 RepID=UPI00397C78E9
MIALWAHPRSRSTAFERVFIERGDFQVFHEPFSSCRFAGSDGQHIPFNHLPQSEPTSYVEVKNRLIQASKHGNVFHKDMCYHCLDQLLLDTEFLEVQVNAFIIRDPIPTILSHAELFPDMPLDAIGYEALYRVFERVSELTNRSPVIIHADDLAAHPDAVIRAFCEAVDIEHLPAALQWRPVMPSQWATWHEWHKDAAESTAITSNGSRRYSTDLESNPRLRAYYEHHLPFYELLNAKRLPFSVERAQCDK